MYKLAAIILINFFVTASIHLFYKFNPVNDFTLNEISELHPLSEYNEDIRTHKDSTLDSHVEISEEPLWFNKNQIFYYL